MAKKKKSKKPKQKTIGFEKRPVKGLPERPQWTVGSSGTVSSEPWRWYTNGDRSAKRPEA